MKYFSILIVIIVCFSAVGSLGAELPSSDSIMDRAFDNYPAGATDLIRTGDTTITTTIGQVQMTSLSSEIDWSKIYPPEMIVSLDLPSLLEHLAKLEEENQSLRKEIERLRSEIHPKKEGEQIGDGNAGRPLGDERSP